MKDDFGNRMKDYEKIETGRRFMPLLPVYARIDGKGFSKFTKGLQRPYDERMSRCMIETTKYLVKETNAVIGYCQSDEISLAWYSDSVDSQIFFDGKVQKMVSVLASMATVKFNDMILDILPEKSNRFACFDARVFQLPSKVELTNTFLWREQDATKNAISMAARAHFSHKELHGKNGSEMQEMMFQTGTNFNDYPAFFKRGTFVRRESYLKSLTQEEADKMPGTVFEGEVYKRHRIVEIDMPRFGSVTNRVGVVFDGEEPIIA